MGFDSKLSQRYFFTNCSISLAELRRNTAVSKVSTLLYRLEGIKEGSGLAANEVGSYRIV